VGCNRSLHNSSGMKTAASASANTPLTLVCCGCSMGETVSKLQPPPICNSIDALSHVNQVLSKDWHAQVASHSLNKSLCACVLWLSGMQAGQHNTHSNTAHMIEQYEPWVGARNCATPYTI
jgi:hypothetical protein